MPLRRPNGPSCSHDAGVVPMVTVSLVADAAVKVQVDSDGRPEQLKVGAWLNPPRSPKVMVPEPFCPGAETAMLNVLGLRLKSSTLRACADVEAEDARVVSPGSWPLRCMNLQRWLYL